MYINKIENRVKTVYYLELLTPETMKLLRRTKSKTQIKIRMVKIPSFRDH